MSVIEPQPATLRTSIEARVRQAPDAVLGAGQPGARRPHRRQARGRARPGRAAHVLQRRGLLPLPGIDPRLGRLHRPADLRQPGAESDRQRRADGADGDDRRRRRRVRPPRHRRHPVVRLQPPGQEVRAARADHLAPRRPHARVRRRGPRAHDGSALRPDPGLLRQAVRPHDGPLHPHPVRPGPGPGRPRRRRARRRPGEAGREVPRQDRRRPRRPQPRSARPSRWPRSAT